MGGNEELKPRTKEAGENLESIGDALHCCWRLNNILG